MPLESHPAPLKHKTAKFSVPHRRKANRKRKKSRDEESLTSEDEMPSVKKLRKKHQIHSPKPSDSLQCHNQDKDPQPCSEHPHKHRFPFPSSESMNSEYTSKGNDQSFRESLNDDEAKEISLSDLKGGWDGWLQGNFLMKLTWDEYKNETDELTVEWAFHSGRGGQAKGALEDAIDPKLGKCTHQYCLGYLCCDSLDFKYHNGVWYWNGTKHTHDTFGSQKCLCPPQQTHLDALLKANPTATAAALQSGNMVSGESLLDISD
uniref:Uncharacterized protein n=1 Tax=Moniliophthora roreri TaxID=221103 RepID=A0A0W0EX18_MONRR